MGSDAERIYFATDQPLLPADTDASVDIYERSGGALSLVTAGAPTCRPGCGNGDFDVEANGRIPVVLGGVVFSTKESLTPADTDGSTDIYRSTAEGPELISQGPNGFNGPFDAELEAVDDQGSAIVFSTKEPLVAADTDSARDVYERIEGSTVLISQGTDFNGEFDATSPDSNPDGSAVLFLTAEPVLAADTDEAVDLYERQNGTTTLVSRGTVPANGDFDVGEVAFTSDDGARDVFTTDERLSEHDEDDLPDIYMRFGNTTSLVSEGSYDPLEGEYPAKLDALDPRANQVIFSSQQVLNEEDRDKTGPDVYEYFYGKTILTSQGPAEPYFPPADTAEFLDYVPGGFGAVYFISTGRLVAEDTDSSPDLYERLLGVPKQTNPFERVEGETRLVSQGAKGFNGAFEPSLVAVSPDASRVLFTTAEPLVNADTDSSADLYERFRGSATKLISAGAQNGNGPYDVTTAGGEEGPAWFITAEQLVPGDTDSEADLYERVEGTTRLVSSGKSSPAAPTIDGSDPASPSNVDSPAIRGEAEAGTTVELYSDPACEGTPLATGTAAQFASPGLPVSVPDNSPSSIFARATDAEENPGPCSSAFTYVEDSVADPAVQTGVYPAGPANDNTPRVRGSAEADSSVRIFTVPDCQGPPAAAGSGAALAGPGIAVTVPDNSTTSFFVEATDSAGNVSQCAGGASYVEDSTPPQTLIESGPRPNNRSKMPVFALASNDPSATFLCSIDKKPPTTCGHLFQTNRLRIGKHRLSVAAVDAVGNVDPTPAIKAWKLPGRRHKRHAR